MSITGEIIAEIHNMYEHLGSKKCTKLIQEHFMFDKMSKQIKNYLKTCDKCQRCKDTNNRNLFGGTKPILPGKKGELINGDYYGPVSYTHLYKPMVVSDVQCCAVDLHHSVFITP